MSDSCFMPFKLHYAETKKNLSQGDAVNSEVVSAGGHLWRITCYPQGNEESGFIDDDDEEEDEEPAADYLAIYLELTSESKGVKAIFEAFPMEKNGAPSSSHAKRLMDVFSSEEDLQSNWGWLHFVKRIDLGNRYVVDVFNAELFGSMAEATMSSITLEDITPATFEVFLRFIYTDALPGDDELGEDGDSPIEMYKHLLAVADRYAMDRLKLMCAKKLWDDVSVDTVAETLSYAETYSCAELKTKCIAFFAEEKNFRKAVLTDGFVRLVHKFPAIVAELREKPKK
ncbi:hypothetical protein BRADI_3g41280v3 [Brachypodium distachyon]|uniref:MATH domain-containing protein n=1 Tax=Brachypodium distachyon TaxID=15368 RepID=A0A0Q3FLQ3_BRADI|nr:hypothetical protein BRADI_3g41280v3 [Brachypodium distachyon]